MISIVIFFSVLAGMLFHSYLTTVCTGWEVCWGWDDSIIGTLKYKEACIFVHRWFFIYYAIIFIDNAFYTRTSICFSHIEAIRKGECTIDTRLQRMNGE